ncbi:flippase [Vibrio splendidus]|uniref:flippase n=1 Tax=Vibrio splendidus TaxID=29497 RepID=UPI002468FDB7|nr:flippase [Vibrio splendidus]MDH6018076.1 flippase [Vibrio splendidus]
MSTSRNKMENKNTAIQWRKKYRELLSNEGVSKYGKNTLWLMSEKVLRMTLGLFIGVWVARYLGPEEFGVLSYAISYVALFSAFASLGMDGIVVRELVKDSSKEQVILGTAFLMKLLGSILMMILVSLTLIIYPNDNNTIVLIIASTAIFQSFNVIDFYFQAKVQGKYIAISNIISLLCASFAKLLMIINHASLEYFAYVILLEITVLSISYIYFSFKRNVSILQWKANYIVAVNLIKDSWPLIFSSLLVTLYMKVDQVMLNNMLGPESVGYYTAATRLSEVWYFIPVVICNSLFPAILNAKKISHELFLERLQKLYDFMLWLALFIAFFVTLITEPLVDFLYGSAYSSSSLILLVHVWSSVFVFIGVASSKWFIAEGLQKQALYRTIAGLLVNVILNYLLIEKYGAIGAAFATLVSQMMASYLFNLFNVKTRNVFFMQSRSILFPIRFLKMIR